MAVVKAPLLSFSGSGQIGKSIVFATWKGQKYARQYVIPSNPQTTAQTTQRDLFKWVHDAYKWLPASLSESWVAYAKGKILTGANAWQAKNLVTLKGAADNNLMQMMAAALGGPPGAAPTVTPGVGQLTVALADPVVSAGWTIDQLVVGLTPHVTTFGEQEPFTWFSGTDTTSPYSVNITGLTAGVVYVVGGGFRYTRPDGVKAYNSFTNSTGTPT